MQPFPSLPQLNTALFRAALVSVVLAGTAGAMTFSRTVSAPNQPQAPLANTEDDRGSGRVAHQADIQNQVSFRGSGRVEPDSTPNSKQHKPDSVPSYRGSGRLG